MDKNQEIKTEKKSVSGKLDHSTFTISLDFELHWGGFEKWPIGRYKGYFDKTREVIPKVLKAFEISGVHCTWATVGMLMHENKIELNESLPRHQPSYVQKELSAYTFLKKGGIGENESHDPYHFADSLIRTIIETPGQELGSHSFAHYYCNEPGQTTEQFTEDALSWNKSAKKYNLKAKSLVFPRNQFNKEYLNRCKEVGIEIVRTNPVDWWWQIDSTQDESKWKRLNRGLDAYFNLGGKTSFKLQNIQQSEGVWLLPASRLLRPFNPKELFLNNLKIKKIKREMTRAAVEKECYHLWWHPHNFGNYPEQNLEGLIEILNHFNHLKKEFGMISMNMGEIADCLSNA